MTENIEISGRLLARNWGVNLLGLGLPIFVAFIAIPYVVRGLGTERFGILSLIWIVLGNFVVFDLGLGRATIKFAAEYLGRGDMEGFPKVVCTCVWLQGLMGVIGALLTASAVPIFVTRILRTPPLLIHDAKLSFLILAASLPVLLVTAALRGVLEAGQHFGAVNVVKVPLSVSLFLLPALGVAYGLRLPSIVLLLVFARVVALITCIALCWEFYPALRHHLRFDRTLLRRLLSYGGWITVTNVTAPLLTQMDRFVLGSLVSLSAVGYYAAPYEAISRIWVIPGSLVSTLFPAFTSLEAIGSKRRIQELCARSVKSLLLILGPIVLLTVILAHELLHAWLGSDFASHGTLVLQILAIGMLVYSLGLIPFSLLQGIGRPDLTAKFLLLELPFYVAGLWFLVKHLGLVGAAIAFALRAAVDALLLFGAAIWLETVSIRSFLDNGLRRSIGAIILFAAALPAVWLARGSVSAQLIVALILTTLFGLGAWSYVLDGRDRSLLLATAVQFRNAIFRP